MSKIDQTYLELCQRIAFEGKEYENKNRGVKRYQIPSHTLRHEFKDGFPALSLKRIWWKAVVAELIWFLRGDNDVKFLNQHGVDIWNKDAYNWYEKEMGLINAMKMSKSDLLKKGIGLLKKDINLTAWRKFTFEEFSQRGEGSVGQNYSVQWRNFNGVDQIKELIEGMRKDIMSSRLKVNAWNPAELDKTALPPCHSEFQIIGVPLSYQQRLEIFFESGHTSDTEVNSGIESVAEFTKLFDEHSVPEFGFELHWNQRSVDTYLGLPFNIASYGLLAKILEEITGFPALAIEGTLKCVHFYDNQLEAVSNLLPMSADKHPNCGLEIAGDSILSLRLFQKDHNDNINHVLEELKVEDFIIHNYSANKTEKVEMLAPKKL
jgi:thymidylate synthase